MERQIKVNNWRILEIDRLLQSGRWYTAKELSDVIEYSTRTIQRDIDYMRDTLNAPIESDTRGYHYTKPNFFIKSIVLTENEALSVAILNPLLEQYRNTPLETDLRSVLEKIVKCLPAHITVEQSFLNPKITFIPDSGEKINSESFNIVLDALKKSCSLTFEYRPLKKSTYMKRKIDPYHVVCQHGTWYVIGNCHDKNAVRIFSIGRMKNLFITENKFTIPKNFNSSDYFDSEMGVWLSDKTPLTVELLFSKDVAVYALNQDWHSDQIVEERDDGVYVKFQTTQKHEVLRKILGQGNTVKVLGPQELVDDVKAELKRSLELYK